MSFPVKPNEMAEEIVVLSGKGGTGKTSITAALAYLWGDRAIVADCDVDAADLHLLMQPRKLKVFDFLSGELAAINPDLCTGCGICAEICRFHAIEQSGGGYRVREYRCEGCGYCARVCPEEAITNIVPKAGEYYISLARTGAVMVHAQLAAGASNSGKLVARVREEAAKQAGINKKDLIIVDGPPGIGCPAISSLSGAGFVLLVSEAGLSGFHDLERIAQLAKHFGVQAGCLINKADLNPEMNKKTRDYLKQHNIALIGEIPYHDAFTRAVVAGKTIVEMDHEPLNRAIASCGEKIIEMLN
jgi:MinD superfamily P-loop ATPase